MAIGRRSAELRAWIEGALSLSDHTDGAIHAAADGTLAIGMRQGPRPEQQDCGAALLWIPRGIYSPHCAAVIADGMGGMEDGGWASRHAVRIVVERCLSGDYFTPRDMLACALADAPPSKPTATSSPGAPAGPSRRSGTRSRAKR